MTDINRVEKAKELFESGYNCAQSVVLAFEDMYNMDRGTAVKISSSFGGGMGRLREVCGAVSGMFMVYGLVMGSEDPNDFEAKKDNYHAIQDLANAFKKENGSYICRELLGLSEDDPLSPVPAKRTGEYYKKRPCSMMVQSAALILDEYLRKKNAENEDN